MVFKTFRSDFNWLGKRRNAQSEPEQPRFSVKFVEYRNQISQTLKFIDINWIRIKTK